jgi:transposase
MVVALDVHKKETVGFVVNGDLESGTWLTVPTTNEHLEKLVPQLEGHVVIIEASTSGKAVARFLKNRGANVRLVQADVLTGHVRYSKSDKLDAKDLARIGLIGGYKTCYIPTADEEELRGTVRHILDIRQQQARLKNQAKAILQRNLVPEPKGNLDSEHVRARWGHLALPGAEKASLQSKLAVFARLREEEENAMLDLCRLARRHDAMKVLMTIPGVEMYTAATVVAFCGDMTRFPDAKKVAAFTGLTPRLHQSGETLRHGRITKRGPNVLRFVLIEATHHVVRFRGRLKNKYDRLARRTGKAVAIVATARTLITAMWSMVRNGTPYDGHGSERAIAKIWRLETVAELVERGHVDAARRLLRVSDVADVHERWKRGATRMVPTL